MIATESVFTNFIALKNEESRLFQFYSISEKQISFALTSVPETTDNFYAGDYFTFGKSAIFVVVAEEPMQIMRGLIFDLRSLLFQKIDISGEAIVVSDSKERVSVPTGTNVLLENAPNEVKVHLNSGKRTDPSTLAASLDQTIFDVSVFSHAFGRFTVGFVVVSVNGFAYNVKIGAEHQKLFRYVSFLARPINYDTQEFFLRCSKHSQ